MREEVGESEGRVREEVGRVREEVGESEGGSRGE